MSLDQSAADPQQVTPDMSDTEGETGVDQAQVNPEDAAGEEAKISKLLGRFRVPSFVSARYRVMDKDRDYIAKDCFEVEGPDSITINHMLRNQETVQAYVGMYDPKPEVLPARRVSGITDPATEAFAETGEIFLSQQAELMRLGPIIEGGMQDMSTNGMQVWKVTLQTDYTKDPVGRSRFGDQQDKVGRYQALLEMQKKGEISEDTAESYELQDLEKTIRLYAALKIEEQIKAVPVLVPQQVPVTDPVTGAPMMDPNTLQPITQIQMVQDEQDPREVKRKAVINGEETDILGLPEIPAYAGFAIDPLQLEDVRWDWTITRPEQIVDGAWIANRTFMSPDAVVTKFGVLESELDGVPLMDSKGVAMGKYQPSADTVLDPSCRVDIEASTVNGSIAVWEAYVREDGRRYVFVEGMKKFIINEVFQATGRRWYPYFFAWKHRVTGQALPLSDVQLNRNLQDVHNNYMSWMNEIVRTQIPTIFIPTGTFDKATMEQFKGRRPLGFQEFDRNKIDDINKAIKETTPINCNTQGLVLAMEKISQAMQMMAGVPTGAQGATTDTTATEAAMANSGLQHQIDVGTVMINRVVSEIFQYMLEIAVKVFPEEHMKQVCGDAAVWPRLGVEELYTMVHVAIRGGIRGKPDQGKLIGLYTQLGDIIQKLGLPINGVEILRDLLEAMDVRKDFRRYIALPQPVAPPGTAAYTPTVGQVPPPASPPQAPAPSSSEPEDVGGAPPMSERPVPNNPAQIPNHPPGSELPQ